MVFGCSSAKVHFGSARQNGLGAAKCNTGMIAEVFYQLVAARQLEVINQQHPFEPLQYLPTTLRLPFAEGIRMLHEAGYEDVRWLPCCLAVPAACRRMSSVACADGWLCFTCRIVLGYGPVCRNVQCRMGCMQADPHGDLTTELERELGKLVKERHKTDFYILTRYPLAVRADFAPAQLPEQG